MLRVLNKDNLQALLKKIYTRLMIKQKNDNDFLENPDKSNPLPAPPFKIFGSVSDFQKNKKTCILIAHDASRTGCPILTWDIALKLKPDYNIILFILGKGSFLEELVHVADYAVLIDKKTVSQSNLLREIVLEQLPKIPIDFAIANSVESRYVIPHLKECNIFTLSLIHEFAAYFPLSYFKEALLWSDKVIFSTKITRDSVVRKIGCTQRTFPIIPQGISQQRILKKELISASETTFFEKIKRLKKEHYTVIVAAGSGECRKGIDLFVKIFLEISSNLRNKKIAFIWAGSVVTEGLFTLLWKGLLDEYQGDNLCEFPGELTDVDSLYELADLFILTSRLDPLPSVVMNAASYALPFVCFDRCSGYPEILADYSKELYDLCVARHLDCYDFSDKVLTFLNNPELSKRTGQQLQAFVQSRFDMKDYVNSLLEEINATKAFLKQH